MSIQHPRTAAANRGRLMPRVHGEPSNQPVGQLVKDQTNRDLRELFHREAFISRADPLENKTFEEWPIRPSPFVREA